jgi:hypothetical protein
LNLIEALRTGRPLRRPIYKHVGSGGDGWLGNDWLKDLLTCSQYGRCNLEHGQLRTTITEEDLLAGDWEVQPKSVTITVKDLADAWKRAETRWIKQYSNGPGPSDIARELGLTDEDKS